MIWEPDNQEHRRYICWCEWEPKVDLEDYEGEPFVTEGALIVDPKVIAGKRVGPASCINVLERQGLTVKWMVPVPYTATEDA